MLSFQTLVKALKERGLTREQGAIATGWGEGDEALERYIKLNIGFTPHEAARQLAQCGGFEIGLPLYGRGAVK